MIEITVNCERCGFAQDDLASADIGEYLKFLCAYCEEEYCNQCEETSHSCDECQTSDICDGCMDSTTICGMCREGLDEELADESTGDK